MNLQPDELVRGDLVEVHWVDIFEDSVGDPDGAEVAPRINVGYFWARKQSKGVPILITTTSIDEETSQSGWCAYPEAVITKIVSIRRKRRPRKKKDNERV